MCAPFHTIELQFSKTDWHNHNIPVQLKCGKKWNFLLSLCSFLFCWIKTAIWKWACYTAWLLHIYTMLMLLTQLKNDNVKCFSDYCCLCGGCAFDMTQHPEGISPATQLFWCKRWVYPYPIIGMKVCSRIFPLAFREAQAKKSGVNQEFESTESLQQQIIFRWHSINLPSIKFT